MKTYLKIGVLILLLLAILSPTTALAQGQEGDKFVMGGSYVLGSGETLNGKLYVLGGSAVLEEGSLVTGDIILAGGSVQVAGQVQGNIVVTGGSVNLQSTAVVVGNVSTVAANLSREPGSQVQGRITNNVEGPFILPFRGTPGIDFQRNFNPLWQTLWFLVRSFLWAALAVIVVLFFPRQTQVAANAAIRQPLISGGLGLLTAVVAPLLLLLIAITIIGIPLSLIGAFLLALAWALGVIVLGTETGKRLADLLKQQWALPVAAGIGTLLLVIVINAIGIIDCIGWIPKVVVGVVGLGAVLLTRFGTRPYPPYALPAAPFTTPDRPGPSPVTPRIPPARQPDEFSPPPPPAPPQEE